MDQVVLPHQREPLEFEVHRCDYNSLGGQDNEKGKVLVNLGILGLHRECRIELSMLERKHSIDNRRTSTLRSRK